MQNVSAFTPRPGQTTVGEMRQPKPHQMVPRAGDAVREQDQGRQGRRRREQTKGGDAGWGRHRREKMKGEEEQHHSCALQQGEDGGQASER